MNDIHAIENIIETLRYYAPMASTAYNDCYASDKFYDAADALEEILQERIDREKGCPVCDKWEDANFCPMCGRKLKEEGNED